MAERKKRVSSPNKSGSFVRGKTRGGSEVRIYSDEAGGDFPVHGAWWWEAEKRWIPAAWSIVRKLYADEKTMIRNARLLFIWRKEGDQFVPPVQNVVEPTSSGTEMANANQSPSNDVFPVDGNLQILGENGTTIRKVKKRIKKA